MSDDKVDLDQLAQELKEGVEIKDRAWRTKTYPDCFLHSDAVLWTLQNYRYSKGDEETAVGLLNALRKAGYVQHVVDPNKPFRCRLKTKTLYFCFTQDKQMANLRGTEIPVPSIWRNDTTSQLEMEEVLKSSSQWRDLQTRVERMAQSMEEMAELQNATTTKLEIVHQATCSLIQTLVSTALLLLLVLFYMALVVIPSLHQVTGVLGVTAFIGTLATGTFVLQGSRLFSVWLILDAGGLQSVGGGDAVEDYEIELMNESDKQKKKRRKMMAHNKHQSTLLLKEPLVREHSTDSANNKNKDRAGAPKIQQRQANDLPDPSTWPHRPVLVCVNTPVSADLVVYKYGQGPCPIGVPFPFESDLFEGICLVRIRNVPNSDNPEGDKQYFSGRRRLFQTVIQGRFKEPLLVSDVLTGHEFIQPLQHLPHPWILKAATNLIGKIAPGAEINVVGDHPTMLASLAATSQIVRGDEPGNEPDIACANTSSNLQEDCSLLGGKFSAGNVSSNGRKLHLANPQRASNYTFDTDTVYTFDFYQSLLNVTNYSLDLGLANIGMVPVLNGQPIQCLAKTTDGRYLWSFQIWHEHLLPDATEDDDETISSMASSSEKKTR